MVTVDPSVQSSPRPAAAAAHPGDARYAIYFAPPRQSAWWRFGCAWLMRDAIADTSVAPPAVAGFGVQDIEGMTNTPRMYGFHATLKPPFRLAAGRHAGDVYRQAANLAVSLKPIALPPLQLADIDGFVALAFAADAAGGAACNTVAAQCVTCFDNLRARPDAAELARRHAAGLTPRQAQLLAAWGYPYVFDAFRFHLTLTNRLPRTLRERVIDTLTPLVTRLQPEPLRLDALAVFEQTAPGAPFVVTRRYAFDGTREMYRA